MALATGAPHLVGWSILARGGDRSDHQVVTTSAQTASGVRSPMAIAVPV